MIRFSFRLRFVCGIPLMLQSVIQTIYSFINKKFYISLQTILNQISYKIFLLLRRYASILHTRLRLGFSGCMNSYLFKIKQKSSPACLC